MILAGIDDFEFFFQAGVELAYEIMKTPGKPGEVDDVGGFGSDYAQLAKHRLAGYNLQVKHENPVFHRIMILNDPRWYCRSEKMRNTLSHSDDSIICTVNIRITVKTVAIERSF